MFTALTASSHCSIVLLVVLGILSSIQSVDATAFVLKGNPTCQNGLQLNINYLTCNGVKNSCDLGDTAFMYGYLVQGNSALTQTVYMKNKACLFGVSSAVTCQEYDSEIDFCSVFGIAGTGCPNTGEYKVNAEVQIPGPGGLTLAGGWWVVVTTEIYAIKSYGTHDYIDDAVNTPIDTCTLRIDAVSTYTSSTSSSSSKSSKTSFLYGFSVAGVVLIGAWFMRKRRTCTGGAIDLDEEEQKGDFEMMGEDNHRDVETTMSRQSMPDPVDVMRERGVRV